jgi:hypothetical protein
MKPLAIALSGIGRGFWEGEMVGNLTNVQCKVIWNCHHVSSLYNKYIQIKMETKRITTALWYY